MLRIAHYSRWMLALIVALAAFGMSLGSASAAPASAGNAAGAGPNARLAAQLRVERQRLKVQDIRLKRADEFAGKIDALIAKLKAKGQDTTALEQAVASFRTGMASARAEWQAASDTLATHAGFDDAGKVTDVTAARATLKDAHGHMEQAHTIGKLAFRDLRTTLIAYRKAHRGTPVTPTPVEP
jgi:hypothetical protein